MYGKTKLCMKKHQRLAKSCSRFFLNWHVWIEKHNQILLMGRKKPLNPVEAWRKKQKKQQIAKVKWICSVLFDLKKKNCTLLKGSQTKDRKKARKFEKTRRRQFVIRNTQSCAARKRKRNKYWQNTNTQKTTYWSL